MRLFAMEIFNFRSYKDRASLRVSDFTAILGRNDVGKSTLLEALEVFFNQDVVRLDQSDPCVHGSDKTIEIACVFEEVLQTLTLDARSQTTLAEERLLNAQGRLEIVKRYDCRAKSIKEEVFAKALHSNDARLKDLLKLKNPALKARAEELQCDLSNVDLRSNAAIRRAIRNKLGDIDMALQLIPLNEEDGKRVWEQIERELPTFALFQADRPSKDDDPEVADPMKVAVANALRDVEAKLEEIKEQVRLSVLDVAQRTLAKLQEVDPGLARQLTPTFKAEPKWDGFKLSLSGDDQIPINKRGSGVRRLVLLSFFRAEAERRRGLSNARRVIYAIEEPESSQHPDNQVLLIRSLLALANDPHTQVLITTHVPAVAALIPTESVRLVSRNAQGHPQISAGGDDVYDRVAAELGVMPDRRAKVAVFVEGPNDVDFISHASRLHRTSDPTLIDLDSDYRIVFIPTGGGTLKHWVDRRYLANAKLTEVHIYDADDQAAPPYGPQINEVNARGTQDIGFLTLKREMENYIHADAIYGAMGCRVAVADWNDVPELVAEQVHILGGGLTAWAALTDEAKQKKVSRAKRRLNTDAMAYLTLAQLQQMDPTNEILSWLHAIRTRAN